MELEFWLALGRRTTLPHLSVGNSLNTWWQFWKSGCQSEVAGSGRRAEAGAWRATWEFWQQLAQCWMKMIVVGFSTLKCDTRSSLEGKFLSSGAFSPLSSSPGIMSSKQNPLVPFLILLCLGVEKSRAGEATQRHPFFPSHHPLFSELERW